MKKHKTFRLVPILIVFVVLVFASSCEKDDNDNNPTNGKTTAVFNPNVTYGRMTDQDGNVYKTIQIGTQTWMAENLRTTKYNDDTSIPNVTDDIEWRDLATGAYCNYNNTTYADTIATYGRLYNWYAVKTGKLCPSGWHVPTDDEWTQLTDFLDDVNFAGGKLKEAGTTHWDHPNEGATNETGFTAIPGGHRGGLNGSFACIGQQGIYWSTTEYNASSTVYRGMHSYTSRVYRTGIDGFNTNGFSVRCIKD